LTETLQFKLGKVTDPAQPMTVSAVMVMCNGSVSI